MVDDDNLNSVLVFAKNATGNVAPVSSITGASTGLNEPWGMTIH